MFRHVPRSALLLALGLMAINAHARDLYVDSTTGDDAVTYSENSQTRPWRSLIRAMVGSQSWDTAVPAQAAQAGDTVFVSGGMQTVRASNSRSQPALNPINNGTASAPIVVRAVGRIEIRTQTGTGDGALIGAYERDYIQWVGNFVLDENFSPVHPDTALTVAFLSRGIVFDGIEVIGINQTYGDNHNGVRLEQADDIIVRNMRISGITGNLPGGDIYHHNNAGVMMYGGRNVLVEHMQISNCGVGIFPKGSNNYGITLRYNRISNCNKGIRNSHTDPSQGQNYAYGNIITDQVRGDGMGIQIAEYTFNWTIVNNTIVNVDNAVYLDWFEPNTNNAVNTVRVGNNLSYNSRVPVNAWEWSTPICPSAGRNFANGAQEWALNGQSYSSLTAWIVACPGELGSATGNPNFVNAASGDFHLQAGSPALTIGRNLIAALGTLGATIPAGAYITGQEVIGPDTGPVPNPPTNVTVRP
jgi:hypothetical protein